MLFIFIGFFLFQDYGITWDEESQRKVGMVSLKEMSNKTGLAILKKNEAENIPDISNFIDREYGPFFEIILVASEKALGLKDFREIFQTRHLLIYFIYLVGLYFFFRVSNERFNDLQIALISVFLLYLTPRIFANSFYNSKDVGFLTIYIISIFTLQNLTFKRGWPLILCHAFVTAIAISLRVIGVIIIPISLACILLSHTKKNELLIGFYKALIYLFATIVITIILHPFLWQDPLNNFLYYIEESSHFRWHGYVLYMSNFVKSELLPLHYLPVWIIITTPIATLLFFVYGFYTTIKDSYKQKFNPNNKLTQDLIFLYFLIAPIITYLIMKPTLYDGWRHFYFIYPPLILIATKGIVSIKNYLASKKRTFLCLLLLLLGAQLSTIIKTHPFQDTYFNFTKKYVLKKEFELDYWGQSNVEALKHILKLEEKSNVITLASNSQIPIEPSVKFVNNEKFKLMDLHLRPKYAIVNYRCLQNCNKNTGNLFFIGNETLGGYSNIYDKKINGEIIFSIYKKN